MNKQIILLAAAILSLGSVGCRNKTTTINNAPAAPAIGPVTVNITDTAPSAPVSTVSTGSVLAATATASSVTDTVLSKAETLPSTTSVVAAPSATPTVTLPSGGAPFAEGIVINITNGATAYTCERSPDRARTIICRLSVPALSAATSSDALLLSRPDASLVLQSTSPTPPASSGLLLTAK